MTTKTEILVQQIHNIANGLPTDAIEQTVSQLNKLHRSKLKEVVRSIDPIEKIELRRAWLEVFTEHTFELEVNTKLEITVDGTGDSEPALSYNFVIRGHKDSYADACDLITKRELFKDPDLKACFIKKKADQQRYQKLLNDMAHKYKLEADFLIDQIMHSDEE